MKRHLHGRPPRPPASTLLLLLVAAAAGAFSEPASGAFRKLPYLTFDGDETAMRVNWQLQTTAPCTLDWGTDETYSLGTVVTTELGPSHQHDRRLAGLDPASLYLYRVRAGDTATGSFRTAPPDDALAVKLFVYGDTRTYPATHDTVAAGIVSAYSSDASFQTIALMTGDLVADGNLEASWDTDFFDPARSNIADLHAHLPVASTRGNHEGTAVLFAKYLPYPWVIGRAWSFDYGPVHVAVVDEYTAYTPGSVQLSWLEDDLATSRKPWKFIVLHEPGWSAGGGHSNELPVQDYIQPLCVEHGVQIVFGGHNHYYARAVVDGVQHVTAGGGGAPLHTPNPTYPFVVETEKAHHFCKIEIDGGTLTCTAVGKAGQVLDSFVLTHTSAPEMPPDSQVSLGPPRSNPFTGETTMSLSLPADSEVSVAVFDASGRLVRSLLDGELPGGAHPVTWNGCDGAGRQVPSGVYFARAVCGGAEAVQRLVRVR
jgi:hypothetical protein